MNCSFWFMINLEIKIQIWGINSTKNLVSQYYVSSDDQLFVLSIIDREFSFHRSIVFLYTPKTKKYSLSLLYVLLYFSKSVKDICAFLITWMSYTLCHVRFCKSPLLVFGFLALFTRKYKAKPLRDCHVCHVCQSLTAGSLRKHLL